MQLLERELELDTIDDWLERLRSGRGGRLLVEGPAGIGKSAVLDTLTDRAHAGGMTGLVAQASEVGSQVAFGVARAALGPSWPESRKQPDHVAMTPTTLRDAVRVALELAERQPVIVAIDDVQWADTASLRWLRLLATRATALPVGIVLAARTVTYGEDPAELDDLLDDRGAVVVRPAPLSVDAAAELIGLRLGRRVDEELSRLCHSETGGNPYLLLALADGLRQVGLPDSQDAYTRVRDIGARAVGRSVSRRLDRLVFETVSGARGRAQPGLHGFRRGHGPLSAVESEWNGDTARAAARRIQPPDECRDAPPVEGRAQAAPATARAKPDRARAARAAHPPALTRSVGRQGQAEDPGARSAQVIADAPRRQKHSTSSKPASRRAPNSTSSGK